MSAGKYTTHCTCQQVNSLLPLITDAIFPVQGTTSLCGLFVELKLLITAAVIWSCSVQFALQSYCLNRVSLYCSDIFRYCNDILALSFDYGQIIVLDEIPSANISTWQLFCLVVGLHMQLTGCSKIRLDIQNHFDKFSCISASDISNS